MPTGEMVDYVAARLADPDEIRRSRQFPYQFLAAYLNASDEVPQKIKAALHKAAEIACGNVPELPGPVVIGLDVSGSMGSPVTGNRGRGATSKMRCVDVAALFAAAILRRNPDSVVIPFDTAAYDVPVDPTDSVLSLAERLAKYGGGGTNCSLPLAAANTRYHERRFAGCVLVSDNESWVGTGRNGSTAVMTEWQEFVQNQLRLGGHAIPRPEAGLHRPPAVHHDPGPGPQRHSERRRFQRCRVQRRGCRSWPTTAAGLWPRSKRSSCKRERPLVQSVWAGGVCMRCNHRRLDYVMIDAGRGNREKARFETEGIDDARNL